MQIGIKSDYYETPGGRVSCTEGECLKLAFPSLGAALVSDETHGSVPQSYHRLLFLSHLPAVYPTPHPFCSVLYGIIGILFIYWF